MNMLRSLGITGLLAVCPALAQEDWPLRFTAEGTAYQVFAPQPERLSGNHFAARMAVSIKRPSDKEAIFGAVWGDGMLEMDRDNRRGRLVAFSVTDARFPGITDEGELLRLRTTLSAEVPKHTPQLSMDLLVSALEEERSRGDGLRNEAPEIIYTETPSALLFIDGTPRYETLDNVPDTDDPVYRSAKGAHVERVSNTPFLVLRHNGQHYLYGSGLWYRSTALEGPWAVQREVPQVLRDLAAKAGDGAALTAPEEAGAQAPAIVMRSTPAELLDLDGPPQYEPIESTGLLAVMNTDRNLFLEIATQQHYALFSGRWYRTADLRNGPWSFVPAHDLPKDFQAIPEGSKKDGVLAHVAGTPAAREAVRDARIPQTAKVDRRTASLTVTYDGDPVFDAVPGTAVELARNASTSVLRINGRYHACDNGIWFESASPDGPWTVSTAVPAAVNDIPPSSEAYNLRYVYIYDHTPDWVYMGYTPGYLGCYVQGDVVVYGTGFYYAPWPRFWRPRPFTWGFGMYYDPWTGWGFGGGWGYNWYGPGWGWGWGGWNWGWGHGGWGGWGYGGWGWWGPCHYVPPCCHGTADSYYGHHTPLNASRSNPSVGSGSLYAARQRPGVTASRVTRATPTANTTKAPVPDHFTDAAGNVYRRNNGGAERYTGSAWEQVPAPRTERPDGTVGRTNPAEAPPVPQARPEARPVPEARPTPGARPEARPTPQPQDPYRIDQERQRAAQRDRTYQEHRARPTPPRRGGTAPHRSTPTTRPDTPQRSNGTSRPGGGSRPSSPAPSRQGGGGGQAPSRGRTGGR